jgi:hypothetical protein
LLPSGVDQQLVNLRLKLRTCRQARHADSSISLHQPKVAIPS